jgi:CHAT domain-containing protein
LPWISQSQGLRIDPTTLNQQLNQKKTVGEQIEVYRNFAKSCEEQFGRLSYEFAATQSAFLDFYEGVLPDWIRDTTRILDTITVKRKELIPIVRALFGDTSYQYAQTVTRYGLLMTNLWNRSLSRNDRDELIDLFDGALAGIKKSKLLSDTAIQQWTNILLARKANIYFKIGDVGGMKILLDSVIEQALKYNLIDAAFPSTIQLYASVILSQDPAKQVEIMNKYDTLVWSNFYNKPKTLYGYRKSSLTHRLSANLLDNETLKHLLQADSLCTELYKIKSHEYALFSLNYRLPILKKIGFKSAIFQTLAQLDKEVFVNKALLTNKDGLFGQYYLEWYKYMVSVNEVEQGIPYLMLAKEYCDTSLNRSTFETTISIYRELKDYYRFRSFDTCIQYAEFLIDLQERAQIYWGNRPIHEYHEMAKLFLSMRTTESNRRAQQYIERALATFESNYGIGSLYYKHALYTQGEIEFRRSGGKKGIEKCWPVVYERLNSQEFVPPLSGGVFDAYADLLENINRSDSADFFHHQTLNRNVQQSQMNVIGFGESVQLKSIQEYKKAQSVIFTKHLDRTRIKNHKIVDAELANLLGVKNQTLWLQLQYRNAIRDARSKKTKYYKEYEKLRTSYDSLINQGSVKRSLLDTLFIQMEAYKGWILENYYFSLPKHEQASINQGVRFDYNWIRNRLKNDEVFIDVCEFRIHDRELGFSPDPSFAFLFIDKNSNRVIPYFFMEENPEFFAAIKDQDYDKLSFYLGELIEQIEPYKKCVIASDGWINLVNFGALTGKAGNFLIENIEFEYIADRSAIERRSGSVPKKGQAVFMGNPRYRNGYEKQSRKLGIFPSEFTSDQLEIPYTEKEIIESSQLLSSAGWSTRIFMDTSFNEWRMRTLQSPIILHVATHGFYLESNENDTTILSKSENSYLRSGLILSAPNTKSSYDNIVSGFEMMDFNWSNISLAVLSACQTAQGDMQMGEGAFGIQRALQIAGVQKVILTTHAVFDKATQLLMRYFYQALLTNNTYAEALRAAQLKMIADPQYNKCKYWAPFKLIHQ